jgi:hypothetical protein
MGWEWWPGIPCGATHCPAHAPKIRIRFVHVGRSTRHSVNKRKYECGIKTKKHDKFRVAPFIMPPAVPMAPYRIT